MRDDYPKWLEEQGYDPATQTTQVARVKRIEKEYGPLDNHFQNGTIFSEVIDTLKYSRNDERTGKQNPSKLPIDGNLYNSLSSYKWTTKKYLCFLQGDNSTCEEPLFISENSDKIDTTSVVKGFTFERDMQKTLRQNISSLDPALKIIDDGIERNVESGLIDITCEDDRGLVVIELKAGTASSTAIAQILGYMGDLQEEEETPTRGILVAYDFDRRTRSAAKAVPSLTLVKYSIEFKFTDIASTGT